MSVNVYNKTEDTLIPVAGGTIYADNPIGSIVPYGGSQVPAGWLICDGRSLSKNDYFDLFKVIGYNYGGSDSTFNVPDLREATTKGVGLSGKSDNHYDADGIALGEFIDDRFQGHEHDAYKNRTNAVFTTAGGTGMDNLILSTTKAVVTDGTNGTPRIGATTEVKAVGVNYIIKVKHTPIPADFMDAVDETVDDAITEKLHYNGRVNTTVRMFITSSQIHTFTASKTGLLKAYMHKSGSGYTARLFVNGVSVDQLSCFGEDSSGTTLPWITEGGIDVTLSTFVKEGDVIKIDSDESGSASINSWYLYATVLQYKS
jgi:microcystin-dependent protein